jgi:hypothetical protein
MIHKSCQQSDGVSASLICTFKPKNKMENQNPSEQLIERAVKTDKPFAWQSRRALYRIRERIGGTQAAYATSVYVALSVLASGAGKQTFSATISVIATHAGLRYRKTHEMLWLLEEIGLILISENRMPGTKANLPHTFTLLTVRSNKRKGVHSNTQDPLCAGSETSHADSPKEHPEGVCVKKDKASPSPPSALPDGSGGAGDAEEEGLCPSVRDDYEW